VPPGGLRRIEPWGRLGSALNLPQRQPHGRWNQTLVRELGGMSSDSKPSVTESRGSVRLPDEWADIAMWRLSRISRVFDVSMSALRNDIKGRRLRAYRYGNDWRVARADLKAWLISSFVEHEPRTRQRPEMRGLHRVV